MRKKKSKQPKTHNPYLPWIIVLIAVAFVCAIRVRLLQLPLERDEGEFAYMGQLMLQGHPPYSLAYNMKLPGIYAAYAVIMAVFGQTTGGIHLGLLLINAAAIVMVFVLGRRLFHPFAGAVAAVAYALLTIQPDVSGLSAHATHFVVLFALGGILLLLKALETGRSGALIGSGLLFGIAFLMKQPGAFFALFGAAYLLLTDLTSGAMLLRQSLRRLGLFLLSAALPFGLTCLVLWQAGVFPRFWFWTYDYARAYGSVNDVGEAARLLRIWIGMAIAPVALIWILALAGFTVFAWDQQCRKRLWFVVGLFCASLLATCAGFRFSGHYFVLMFPALALLAGLCVSYYTALLGAKRGGSLLRLVPTAVLLLSVCLPIYQQRAFFFRMSTEQASRHMYGSNPFPEAVEIAKALGAHTNLGDKIGILGSEPEILFYAQRQSATGYIYMYSLTEPHPYADAMRSEMIREMTRARPRYLVLVTPMGSWVSTHKADLRVVEWVRSFIKGYRPIAGVWVGKEDADKRVYSSIPPGAVGKPVIEILQRMD